MAEQKNRLSLKRDVLLLVVGVFLGFVTSIVTVRLSSGYETQRLLVEHRISAIEKLSQTQSDLATKVVPRAEELLNKFLKLKEEDGEWSEPTKREIEDLGRKLCREWIIQSRNHDTQIAILSALFSTQFSSEKYTPPKCLDFGAEAEKKAGAAVGDLTRQAFYDRQIEAIRSLIQLYEHNEEHGRKLVGLFADALHANY